MGDARIPKALTIAGSDSGGGAGIQADLKTFTALGVYGMSAITALTAQNTQGVAGVHEVPPDFVALQIDQVAQDIGVDSAKTGMLSNAGIIEAVAESVRRNHIELLVVDPVMVAKSGDTLLQESAREALIRHILPIAYIVTPNTTEAAVLTGTSIDTVEDMQDAAREIFDMGPHHVLIKGGHMSGEVVEDILFDGRAFHAFRAARIDTKNTHGTGCTLSAAIAAYLAKGSSTVTAVEASKSYVTEAIRRSLSIGSGHGPLNHVWQYGLLG